MQTQLLRTSFALQSMKEGESSGENMSQTDEAD